ncbi:MAG: hypothetical protein AB7I41_09765 [Candidatus Sericytochromatia bacterium]
MPSLFQHFVLMMDVPLTISHPMAIVCLCLSGLGLLTAGALFLLRVRVILPELANLRTEQIEAQKELQMARQDLGLIKDQLSDGVELLSRVHQQVRLLTLFRIVLSVGLMLGRTGALALVFRFMKRHIWWQTLAKEGIEEVANRLQDYLFAPTARPHDS